MDFYQNYYFCIDICRRRCFPFGFLFLTYLLSREFFLLVRRLSCLSQLRVIVNLESYLPLLFFFAFACNVKSFVIVFLFLLYLLLNSFFGWTYELFYLCFRDCYPGHLVTQDRHHYRNNFIGQTGDSLFRSLQLIWNILCESMICHVL